MTATIRRPVVSPDLESYGERWYDHPDLAGVFYADEWPADDLQDAIVGPVRIDTRDLDHWYDRVERDDPFHDADSVPY
jgi:hypothetical protein